MRQLTFKETSTISGGTTATTELSPQLTTRILDWTGPDLVQWGGAGAGAYLGGQWGLMAVEGVKSYATLASVGASGAAGLAGLAVGFAVTKFYMESVLPKVV